MTDELIKSRQDMVENAYSLAFENEQKYGCCPQSVLAAIQDILGIIEPATFKTSHSLAGGGALMTTGTCGALSGGLIALSSVFGRDWENFNTGLNIQFYKQSYKLGKQLYNLFIAEYGSPICADVQTRLMGRSFNMWDRNDYLAFEEAGGHRDKCPSVTGKVAAWTVGLLMEEEEKAKQSQT